MISNFLRAVSWILEHEFGQKFQIEPYNSKATKWIYDPTWPVLLSNVQCSLLFFIQNQCNFSSSRFEIKTKNDV